MASPLSSPTSPRSCIVHHSHAINYPLDSVLFGGGTIISRRSSVSPSLRLVQRRGWRPLPGLTITMAAATSTPEEISRSRTLYHVLGVAKEATEKEVRSAYRRLALRFHPDAVSEAEKKEANTKAFLEIHSAYLTLSDQATRSLYDTQISPQSSMSKGYCAPRGGGRYTTQRSSSVRQAYSPRPSSPVSFSYQSPQGRNWETDQCW